MSRNRRWSIQLHKKRRARAWNCALGLAIVILLGSCILNQQIRAAAALKPSHITGAQDSDQHTANWHDTASPKDLDLYQKLSLSSQDIDGGSTQTLTDDSHTWTISKAFSRTGTFSLTTLSASYEDPEEYTTTENSWDTYESNGWKYSRSRFVPRGSRTYYRVVTDPSENTYLGGILFNYYRTEKGSSSDCARDMILSVDGLTGYMFLNLARDCAQHYGWKGYTAGQKIPLLQNGKPVVRIEMVTVSGANWYGKQGEDTTTYFDRDLLVYTSHNYSFDYSSGQPYQLGDVSVKNESGRSLTSMPSADRISLSVSVEDSAENASKIQYALSDSASESGLVWQDYGTPFSPNGKKYLYVKQAATDVNSRYIDSEVKRYSLSYLPESTVLVSADPANGSGMDVGDTITLSSGSGTIIYTTDEGRALSFSRADPGTVDSLNAQAGSRETAVAVLKNTNNTNTYYLKLNGLWYQSSCSPLYIYTGPIEAGTDLRKNNSITIRAIAVESGKDPGETREFRYVYSMRNQTAAPETLLETSSDSPTVVSMGTQIELACTTSGSRIFYTTNGSTPSIRVNNGDLECVNGDEYIRGVPITVNEDFANYGKNFTIMVQAVTVDDSMYRVNQDSAVARFVYAVNNQIPVEKVTSVPITNNDSPTEVKIGSSIQLYSNTSGVDIYYTLDGSEPQFNGEAKTTSGTTELYDGSTGVVVPEQGNNTFLTITAVAYKQGLATSEISRLVFRYPESVSVPYANPAAGAVAENTEVTLSTTTEDAEIYYEIAYNEDEPEKPSESSRIFDASNPIKITKKTTIKAIAIRDGSKSDVSTMTYTVLDKLSAPKASIDTGTTVSSGTAVTLEAGEGTTIHYTLDGSDPADAFNKKVQVGTSAVISGDPGALVILRAYASRTGYSNSDVATYSYSISAYEGGIYADKESGSTVKNGEIIRLNTDMSDADIYYTTDGTTPSDSSTKGSSVTIQGEPGEKVTIMALALADGTEKTTSFATFIYTIMDRLSAPSASVPTGAVFTQESVVKLTAETGQIYYTTDGSEPGTGSSLYKDGITVDHAMTIMAVAVEDDYQQSEISTFTYGFADQVEAPQANFASGEVEMGTMITFATETEGAAIYYRTDGADPDPNEKDGLETYTGPIQMDRAATFKMIAVKEHMQNSKVVTVGYTVREPMVEEVTEEEEEQYNLNNTGRLQSRDSFKGMESGPAFTDVVLKNATFGAVVSADEGVLPDGVQLKVEQTQVTDSANRMVKQIIQDTYGIVASYDVTLLVNGEETQPDGVIEIGLPIPVKYQNSIIHVARIEDDGSIQVFDTRRSNGVAYAKVDHLSVYSIAAPVEYEQEQSSVPWFLILYSAAVGFLTLGILLIYQSRKRNREDEEQDV